MNQSIFNEKLDGWIYIVVFLCSCLFILAGLYSENIFEFSPYADKWKIGAHFLKELGVAGIISLIVIFTIERFSRKSHERAANELVEKINSDLFHAIYNRYIPKDVFAEVEKCLMQSGVFRRGHEINYTIENIEEDDDGVDCNKHVKCLAECRYTIHNITEREIEHTVDLMLERPIDPQWDSYCKIISVEIDGEKLSESEMQTSIDKTDAQVSFKRNVKIPPRGCIGVNTLVTLLKQKIDSEIWVSRLPSDGIKLTVSMPSRDIDVFAKAHHSEMFIKTFDNKVTKSWELKHGMFPFQSIVFWWHS